MAIVGDAAANVLRGTATPDEISGLAGNDTVFGRAGGDIAAGNGGDDTLWGGEGSDSLFGGAGKDVIFGFGAADTDPTSADIQVSNVGVPIFDRPVFATSAPGDPDRLYVVEQRTRGHPDPRYADRADQRRAVFDLSDGILAGGRQGLLGLAFQSRVRRERPVLRLSHPGERGGGRAVLPALGANPDRVGGRRGERILSRRTTGTQPQRRLDGVRPGRDALRRGRRRGRPRRSAGNAQNQRRALGQDAAHRRRRRRLRRRASRDYAIPDGQSVRRAAPGADESGRSGSATRGASASTA